MVGEIFGDWTVIREAESRGKKQKKKCVLAKCICGVEKIVQLGNLTTGSSKRCWGCGVKHKAEINRKRADRSGIVNKRAAYGRYKTGARKRGLVFEIDFNQFLDLSSQNCHYCGAEPSNCYNLKYHKGPHKGQPRSGEPFIHNGIDRIDSENGYVKDNCVPCCKRCNLAKNDMGEAEFYNWLDRVYHHCEGRMKTNGEPLSSRCIFGKEMGRSSC